MPIPLFTTCYQVFALPINVIKQRGITKVNIKFMAPILSNNGQIKTIKYFYSGQYYNVVQDWDGGKEINITGLADAGGASIGWDEDIITECIFMIPTYLGPDERPTFMTSINFE